MASIAITMSTNHAKDFNPLMTSVY